MVFCFIMIGIFGPLVWYYESVQGYTLEYLLRLLLSIFLVTVFSLAIKKLRTGLESVECRILHLNRTRIGLQFVFYVTELVLGIVKGFPLIMYTYYTN